MRQRPSTHLLILLSLFLLNGLAYLAIHRAGLERGHAPSMVLAIGHLSLFLPLIVIFIWLARRGYQGDWTLLTVAVLLFGVGQFMQYRLFTDPEYRADNRKQMARIAREAKADTIRQRSINDLYDAEKKRALFRDPDYRIPMKDGEGVVVETGEAPTDWSLTLASTFRPLLALAGLVLAFLFAGRERILLALQRKSFVLGLLTIVSFIPLALLSSRGKFYGSTTPWEPVKVAFLASYAGILTDHYRKLSQTRWGLPPWRFLLPLLMIAAMPVAAFLLLEDFGQLLVFLGVYLMLYLVAVRRLPQLTMALVLVGVLLTLAVLGLGIYSRVTMAQRAEVGGEGVDREALLNRMGDVVSRGVPIRIHQRFHLWLQGGNPPESDKTWWWPQSLVRGFGSRE
ncbi:MAG: hypothetical protein ACKOB4_14460, partial [Acidobacteriota bacterium]